MQINLYLALTLASSGLVSATFDVRKDSCRPTQDTFGDHRDDKNECSPAGQGPKTARFTCTGAEIEYDFKANTIKLMSDHSDYLGDTTIHGACTVAGNQVAHIDLHMPATGPHLTVHTFAGLNRLCDLGLAHNTPKLTFYSYALTQKELGYCRDSPVKPIS